VIVVVERHNAQEHADLLDEMFCLRARIFHDRLGWDVQVIEGRERDRYDDEGPVYIIYTDERLRQIKGSLRLLPTTGPTLLTDFFSDTLPDGTELTAPTIWECTRFCLNDEALAESNEGLVFAVTVMLIALGDLAVRAGIESIVGNFDSSMLRLYRLLGCEVDVLGSTSRYGQPTYLGLHPISASLVRRIMQKRKVPDMALEQARFLADRQVLQRA
jgi:acyl homoserine lactone synthase